MCVTSTEEKRVVSAPAASNSANTFKSALLLVLAFSSVVIIAQLGAVIAYASRIAGSADANPPTIIVNNGEPMTSTSAAAATATTSDKVPDEVVRVDSGENVCAGAKLEFPNVECIVDAVTNVGPQAGGNVTKGYNGTMQVGVVPITTPYWKNGMCPVNVHWHLGAEHLSAGQFDETGSGPRMSQLDGDPRGGYQCTLYDAADPKFTTPYEWKHCDQMVVGQTYEVHWPHSAAGACGTPNQYQTPFYDGVFCGLDMATFSTLSPQQIASAVGVQAQVFTIVNDETYYYPDLMRGMLVEGDMGSDIAMYTGSTTGDSRSNQICSQYSPITWQVDRKCHMISASTFDKMCADMKTQRDDMKGDTHPHGSRELVADELAAANHANRFLRSN